MRTRVTAFVDKAGRAGIAKAIMVDNKVGVDMDIRDVQRIDQGFQAALASTERRCPRTAEIKAVVRVVADRLIAAVSASGRWDPDTAVPGLKNVGRAVLQIIVGALKDLQDRRRGGVQHFARTKPLELQPTKRLLPLTVAGPFEGLRGFSIHRGRRLLGGERRIVSTTEAQRLADKTPLAGRSSRITRTSRPSVVVVIVDAPPGGVESGREARSLGE